MSKLEWLIVLGIIIGLFYFTGCTKTSNGERIDRDGVATMCLDGHLYYWFKQITGHQGFAAMAIILTDDGKPVKCQDGGRSYERFDCDGNR